MLEKFCGLFYRYDFDHLLFQIFEAKMNQFWKFFYQKIKKIVLLMIKETVEFFEHFQVRKTSWIHFRKAHFARYLENSAN